MMKARKLKENDEQRTRGKKETVPLLLLEVSYTNAEQPKALFRAVCTEVQ